MGTVNFSGVGTGIDWTQLIDAEIQARTQQLVTPIQNRKDTYEQKISAFEQLRSSLSELLTALEAMDTPAELRSYSAASSNESVLEATASSNARAGTYLVRVNQVAAAENETHSGVDEDETVVNNTGSSLYFAYTYAGESVSVEVPDGTTLAQLASLINNDSTNPGVTASILDDGSDGNTSHHLVLRGNDTGADYAIAIDDANTTLAGDWSDLSADASAGASSISISDASVFQQYQAIVINDDDSSAEYHIISSVAGTTLNLKGTLASDFSTAQNAYATPRGIGSGLSASASSGDTQVSVDDASHFQVGKSVVIADGSGSEELSISAVDTTNNTITFSSSLSNGYGADAYVTQLEGGRKFTFESADFTQVQAARNAQVRVDGYPSGSWIERSSNVVNDVIPGVTLNLLDDSAGSDVTVSVNPDTEAVKSKIQDFVDAYNTVKRFLNENTAYDAQTDQAGTLLGDYVATLIEQAIGDIVVSAAPGFEDGTDPYTNLGQVGIETVGRSDDQTALGTLTIDETTLDAALSDDFEGVIRLLSEDFAGYSDSDYLTFYAASSLLTQPGKYDVQADFDASGNLTAGRMKLTSESSYRSADLDAPYIVGTSGNPESQLWVRATWDGSSSTQSAVIRLTQGIAGRLADTIEDFLDNADGIIHNVEQGYQDMIDSIDTRIEQQQQRLEDLRQQLTQKYARLEQLLTQLQSRQDWISKMAQGLGQQQ